ncbi:hypothetical protein ACHAXA_006980 [Cyclostephanos tholiformis]|uniref:Uncharacterized protein n=1 Tax=Cyclostephanos tholiformis TaxID=382380 RepID=A0ABD3RXG8_9STRA
MATHRRLGLRRAVVVVLTATALHPTSSAYAFLLLPSPPPPATIKRVDRGDGSGSTGASSPSSSSSSSLGASFLPPEMLDGIASIVASASSSSSSSPPEYDDASSSLSPLVEGARAKFWFYFLAGSGAGGIGAAQLPSIFRDVDEARDAASRGRGGKGGGGGGGGREGGGGSAETLDAGPFVKFYYDSEISVEDLMDAIGRAPSSEYISRMSTSRNYMASRGYIERGDYARGMNDVGCDPLASYVLFDAISGGKGGVVSPIVYEGRLKAYREAMAGDGGIADGRFAADLNGFLAVKLGAFVGLVFCLLVDIGLVAKNGIQGFLS